MKYYNTIPIAMLLVALIGCDGAPPGFLERPADYWGDLDDNPSDDIIGRKSSTAAEWTFEATKLEEVVVQFDPTTETVRQFGEMKEETVLERIIHTQVNRPQKVEVFKQGTDEQSISEFFKQNENDDAQGLLDVLIVIDNSSSMAEEQRNLSDKMMPLLSYVSESDWRIGVVTTDESDGCLRDVIYKNQANVEAAFSAAILAGVSGSGIEAGVPQAVRALKPDCLGGAGWLRPDSTLAILIVSDEDNCSDGKKCRVTAHNSGDFLLDHLSDIRVVGVNARVFGLIWHASQDQSQCPSAFRAGQIYSNLIDQTGGSWGSICDSDYSETLRAMSLDLSIILKTQFTLRYKPYLDTLEVLVNGEKITDGFRVKGNVLEFDEAPAPGAKISINYNFSNSEPQESFPLAEAADPQSLLVYLDGQPSSTYYYDRDNRRLEFPDPPQAREIKVLYRLDNQLETEFPIEPMLDPRDIQVSIGGQTVNPSDYFYQQFTGKIIFADAPRDGSEILIQFNKVVGPLLQYPVFAPANSLDSVVVKDEYGYPIAAVVEGQSIVIHEDEYRFGRPFVIEYSNYLGLEQQLELGYSVFDNRMKVSGNISGNCTAFSLEGKQLDFSSCYFGLEEIVELEFTYIKDHVQEFDLTSDEYDLESVLDQPHQFSVMVNGLATEAFTIQDLTLVLDEPLPLGAIVIVKLYKDATQ